MSEEQEQKTQQLQENLYAAAIALLEYEGANGTRLTIPGTDPPIVIVMAPEKHLQTMLAS